MTQAPTAHPVNGHPSIHEIGLPSSLMQGRWKIHGIRTQRDASGRYPGFVALVWRVDAPFRDLPWSTHRVWTSDGGQTWEAGSGHYDMTRKDAEADWLSR